VTSDARARPQEEDAQPPVSSADQTAENDTGMPDASGAEATDTDAGHDMVQERTAEKGAAEKGAARRGRGDDDHAAAGAGSTTSRPGLALVPVLAVLLVLLLAGVGFLWFTRPGGSAVRTSDYVGALEAARSGVVDMTSFDYLTLDDDLEQIRRVTTGDLKKEAVDQLDSRRKQITDSQATVNTTVITAGVTKANATDATVLLVIQSTQKSTASAQAQVLKYRIRVELEKKSGRWLLSGIAGTGTGSNG
jgi:Mce-associated membrane protein